MSTETLEGRQKTFAEKVAEGHTATEAYLLAGYRPVKRETAHRAASRLYSNPGVRTYIRELRRTGDELAREETTLTIAKKLAFLARLVLTSSATLREDDPLIQSHRILKDGSTSIRIPCKLKALKMHSELAGHFLPEPTEPPPPVDTLQLLFDQIRSGRFSESEHQTPQNVTSSETEPALPANDGRAGTSGDADLFENVYPAEQISQPQQTSTYQVAVPHPRDETWTPASADEQELAVFPQENTGLYATTLQQSEKWHQASERAAASQCGPTGPHWPLTPTKSTSSTQPIPPTSPYHVAVPPPRDETWAQASGRASASDVAPVKQEHERTTVFPLAGNTGLRPPQCGPTVIPTETLPRPIASPPEYDGIASQPHWPLTATETVPTTTNPPTPQEPAPDPQTQLPVCKLKTEPLKTSPPLSPLTQARKAAIAQLQQSSPIRHLYETHISADQPTSLTNY